LYLITNPNYKEAPSKYQDDIFHPKNSTSIDVFQDISYTEIGHISEQPNVDTIYVCDMHNKLNYQPLEFLEISSSRDRTYITAEVNFRISEWQSHLSLINFTQSLRMKMEDKYSISSEQENLFDEDLFHLKFNIVISKYQDPTPMIETFTQNIEKAHHSIFSKHAKKRLYLAC
jgi:hypothetical protein